MTAEPPRPPQLPPDEECCHRGCDPCIFDYYDSAMERWRRRVEALGYDPDKLLAEFASKS